MTPDTHTPDTHDHAQAGPRPAARNVPAQLLALREEDFTGSVVVSSAPGGTIHLERGLITAIETPGAPTAETLLLKSGRIGQADWTAAETAASSVGAGDLGAALVARGSIGAAELEAVCAAAVFDGAFALVLSPPGAWETVEAAPPAGLALRPGIEPKRLFEETARRTALLTRAWGPPGELARTRIRPAAGVSGVGGVDGAGGVGGGALPGPAAVRIPARHREILAAATGRRTARDIGFALGRGVFAVLLDLVRMDARQLLHREPADAVPMAPSVAPRTAPGAPLPTDNGQPLPRRVPGARNPAGVGGGVVGAAGAVGGVVTGGAAAAPGGAPHARRADLTERAATTEPTDTTVTTEKSTP
ncbi:hypothetical protein OG401_08155 [Kitasatospora purpeofusca]|uniref:hypothetical protein n=1 Tax=Kitasatospora purpeofusca TaxID=67352 RepID=UPI0022578E74|nr:hypothetical protein [Kitasatospora purpeofusca]MCX4684286.1 hypothetical protein [Kitasatospora purpeofusca]